MTINANTRRKILIGAGAIISALSVLLTPESRYRDHAPIYDTLDNRIDTGMITSGNNDSGYFYSMTTSINKHMDSGYILKPYEIDSMIKYVHIK